MSNYSTIMGFGVYGYAVVNLFQAAKRQLEMFKQFLHKPGSISQTRPGPSSSRGRREEQRVSVHEKETRQDMFPSPGHCHTQPSKRPDLRTDISARMPKKKQPWWLWPQGIMGCPLEEETVWHRYITSSGVSGCGEPRRDFHPISTQYEYQWRMAHAFSFGVGLPAFNPSYIKSNSRNYFPYPNICQHGGFCQMSLNGFFKKLRNDTKLNSTFKFKCVPQIQSENWFVMIDLKNEFFHIEILQKIPQVAFGGLPKSGSAFWPSAVTPHVYDVHGCGPGSSATPGHLCAKWKFCHHFLNLMLFQTCLQKLFWIMLGCK